MLVTPSTESSRASRTRRLRFCAPSGGTVWRDAGTTDGPALGFGDAGATKLARFELETCTLPVIAQIPLNCLGALNFRPR